jgi:hypothetical protein
LYVTTAAADSLRPHVGRAGVPARAAVAPKGGDGAIFAVPAPAYAARMRIESLLRTARALKWLGVIWNFGCWGVAAIELQRNLHGPDVIGDAIPIALLGGIGFTVAFLAAWAFEGVARRRIAAMTEAAAPREPPQ